MTLFHLDKKISQKDLEVSKFIPYLCKRKTTPTSEKSQNTEE